MFARFSTRRAPARPEAAVDFDEQKIASAVVACCTPIQGGEAEPAAEAAPVPSPKVRVPPHMRHLMIPIEEKLAVYSRSHMAHSADDGARIVPLSLAA